MFGIQFTREAMSMSVVMPRAWHVMSIELSIRLCKSRFVYLATYNLDFLDNLVIVLPFLVPILGELLLFPFMLEKNQELLEQSRPFSHVARSFHDDSSLL